MPSCHLGKVGDKESDTETSFYVRGEIWTEWTEKGAVEPV